MPASQECDGTTEGRFMSDTSKRLPAAAALKGKWIAGTSPGMLTPRSCADVCACCLPFLLVGPRPTLHDVDYVIGTLLKADINAMKNKDLDIQAERNERRGMKRNNVEGPGSQQANAPPPNDVYRMRQKMKL